MRKVKKNPVIIIKAMKRHPEMLLADTGKNYIIVSDVYTSCIKFAEWRYWILKPKGNKFTVLKSIPDMTRDRP